MSLSPGARIGAYEIKGLLGAGGMGEVYRAHDTKLNRDVAIKVLPELFASDADRLARFTREAQTLAALNHPNIAAIYGIEDRALVMELVEGDDLSTHIARGAIPYAEALPIARQIADALEAAHAQGIIHRDLKPANIKVRPDGTVKVLDFGLAKALTQDPGPGTQDLANSPTLTARATQMGMILGTAAYMAPEQAKGRPVDRRADVWAFGCVLYEMLAGRRAFEGEDITDTLAAIVRGEPDWTRLPAGLPPTVRVLLERCLVKDRTDRLSDMSVVRFLLSDTAKTISGTQAHVGESAPAPTAAPPPRRIAALVLVATTAVLAIGATYGLTRWLGTASTGADGSNGAGALAHVSLAMPEGDEIGDVFLRPIAVSDEGARVAYVRLRDGRTKIFVRTLSEPVAKALDGTDGGTSPFFSPDGQWMGFFSGGKLRKISVAGAAVQPLADAPAHRGGSWSADGYIYFAPTNSGTIWRVPEGGGTATEVTRKDPATGEINHRWPHVVAGTNRLLFGAWTGPGDDEQSVAVQTIGTPGHHVLVKGANAPRYAPGPGVLIYSQLGELFAVSWQPTDTSLGQAVPVAMPELTSDSGGNEGAGNYAVSSNGTLMYVPGGRGRDAKRLVWIDRAGKVEPSAWPERVYENVAISPDGTRAVVQIKEGTTTLWMADFERQTLTPLGTSAGSSQAPLWTHDGARIIYRGTRKGFRNLYWRPADGSGAEEQLTSKPDVVQTPTSVSADGRWLLFSENAAQGTGGSGVWAMRLDGDRTPRQVFSEPAGELDGQISLDGKWIAFEAPVASRQEIFVAPFPGPGPRRQISNGGGVEPLWSRDGRELFFQSGGRLMGVGVTFGATFAAGAPRVIHEGRFLRSINSNTPYTTTRDGQRFLRIQQVDPERVITHLSLVLNWFEEVRRMVRRQP